MKPLTYLTVCLLFVTISIDLVYAQDNHPGRLVYEKTCAACHSNDGNSRAPALESLRKFRRTTVEYAINLGYMKLQAKNLSAEERRQLLDWLSQDQEDNDAWIAGAMCTGETARIDTQAPVHAQTWGLGPNNWRYQSAETSGLSTDNFDKLELAWAFALPQTPSMRSQPVVIGDTLFIVSSDSGRMFALDTNSGCLKWRYEAQYPLRSSLSVGFIDNSVDNSIDKKQAVIVMGDVLANVIAIDAVSGKQVWSTHAGFHEGHRITGAPVIYDDRVYAPL